MFLLNLYEYKKIRQFFHVNISRPPRTVQLCPAHNMAPYFLPSTPHAAIFQNCKIKRIENLFWWIQKFSELKY